jgi:hypothetical protein
MPTLNKEHITIHCIAGQIPRKKMRIAARSIQKFPNEIGCDEFFPANNSPWGRLDESEEHMGSWLKQREAAAVRQAKKLFV